MKRADLVLINGNVYSIDKYGNRIGGTAVAVSGEKIIFVGEDKEIKSYIDKETRVIDCGGRSILPGLSDTHCHPSIAGATSSACDLFGIYRQEGETAEQTIEKYQQRLKEYIETNPDKELYRGTGWVEGNFVGEDDFPTCEDLDKICSDKPVILEAFSQHNLWVNSKAMEIAGVNKDTPDPSIGKIYRFADGSLTGIFNDPEAMDRIKLNVPGYDLSVEEYKESLLWYQKECANKYGVTLAMDCMYSDNARDAYVELAKEGKLTMRMRGVYFLEPKQPMEQLKEFISRKGQDNIGDDFRIDTIKMFAEGEFSLLEPFEDAFCDESGLPKGHNGPLYFTNETFEKCAAMAMEAGFNIHVHAMGDGAVKQSVECLVNAQKKTGKQPRNTIAHLMLVPEECAVAMGENDIVGNCQLRWMVYDDDIYGMIAMMGKERAESAYPLRILLDNGVVVAQGTDFPVTPPPSVMHAVQCAMTRRVFKDAGDYERLKVNSLGDEELASLDEAMKIVTMGSAYQTFLEDVTGSIEPGKSAELVILDRNIEKTPVDEIYSIEVEKTIFKGKVVYDNGKNI